MRITEQKLIKGPPRTPKQTHKKKAYGTLHAGERRERSPSVFSRPEGLQEGGLSGAEYLKVPSAEAELPPCNLRNQAVMLAATVSDYAQEILCPLCSKQFTLTWAQRECVWGGVRGRRTVVSSPELLLFRNYYYSVHYSENLIIYDVFICLSVCY